MYDKRKGAFMKTYIVQIKNVIIIQLLFHLLYTSTNIVIPTRNR